jgi:hypothetical protein
LPDEPDFLRLHEPLCGKVAFHEYLKGISDIFCGLLLLLNAFFKVAEGADVVKDSPANELSSL